jgi:hypothetical protein
MFVLSPFQNPAQQIQRRAGDDDEISDQERQVHHRRGKHQIGIPSGGVDKQLYKV